MDYPLSYADAVIVIIIAGGTALAVRRSYGVHLKEMITLVRRAGQGDIDLRLNFRRFDAIGDLADAIDVLLSRRASESAELTGITEEFDLYKKNTEKRLAAGLKLTQTKDPTECIRLSVRTAQKIIGAEQCLLFLTPPLVAAPSAWHYAAGAETVTEGYCEPDQFARQAMEEGRTVLCENIAYDESYYADDTQPFGLSYNTTLVAPLVLEGASVGALQLCEKGERFDSYDEESLEFLARFIVTALVAC